MNTTLLRSAKAGFLMTAAITAGLLSIAPQRLASQSTVAPCEPINTQLDGATFACSESPIGLCAVGTISSGPLKGTKEAVYVGFSQSAGMPGVEAPSTVSYSGSQVFRTDKGDLHMSVVGVSDYARLVFTEVARITNGTGRFAGATGNLFISGTFAPDTISFRSRVTGEICFAPKNP